MVETDVFIVSLISVLEYSRLVSLRICARVIILLAWLPVLTVFRIKSLSACEMNVSVISQLLFLMLHRLNDKVGGFQVIRAKICSQF